MNTGQHRKRATVKSCQLIMKQKWIENCASQYQYLTTWRAGCNQNQYCPLHKWGIIIISDSVLANLSFIGRLVLSVRFWSQLMHYITTFVALWWLLYKRHGGRRRQGREQYVHLHLGPDRNRAKSLHCPSKWRFYDYVVVSLMEDNDNGWTAPTLSLKLRTHEKQRHPIIMSHITIVIVRCWSHWHNQPKMMWAGTIDDDDDDNTCAQIKTSQRTVYTGGGVEGRPHTCLLQAAGDCGWN